MIEASIRKKLFIRSCVSGIFFVIVWSGWAYYSNLSYGEDKALRSAFTQVGFTMINTFIYTYILEYMFFISRSKIYRIILAFILPNFLATLFLVAVHYFRETPNILQTVFPILLVLYFLSTLYFILNWTKDFKISEL